MPSLRDIKRRIKSVKNTRQITKAMKMVSAAKLKKAQDDILAARPYADKMTEFVASLAQKTTPESHPLLGGPVREEGWGAEGGEGGEAAGKRIGVLLITSDRGLCGSFNAVLFRTIESFLSENPDSSISLYLIGKRAIEYFKRRGYAVINSRPAGSGRPNYSTARATAEELIQRYIKGEFDEVRVIYSEFRSALSQRPVVQNILPIAPPLKGEAGEEGAALAAEPGIDAIYEPSVEAVATDLLPKYIEVQVFRSLLESAASEHGARMTAMDSASKNASEMIDRLTLKYNRLRQAAITKELMEIIGGAEALKG